MKSRERQPAALSFLLFVFGCERFAYYGLRASISLLFLHKLELDKNELSTAYALLTAALFLAPLLGGLVADRFLGRHKAIVAGGTLMAIGVLLLATTEAVSYGLGAFIAGSALFRPTVPALVGDLYRQGDARRDAGFTWLLLAAEVGSFIGPLVLSTNSFDAGTSTLSLIVIAFGVLAATLGFALGLHVLRAEGFPGSASEAPAARLTKRDIGHIAIAVASGLGLVGVMNLAWPALARLKSAAPWVVILPLVAIALAIDVIRSRKAGIPRLRKVAVPRLAVLGSLGVFMMVSYAASGVIMNAWFHFASPSALSSEGVPSWLVYSLPSLVSILAAIPIAIYWRKLDASPRRVSGTTKMAFGLALLCFAALILSIGGKASGTFLILVSILSGVGDIVLYPVGLSMVSKLAPPRYAAFAMASWTALSLGGHALGLALGTMTSPWVITGVLGAASALLFVLTPRLRLAMAGAEDPPEARAAGAPYRSEAELSDDEPEADFSSREPADEDLSTRQMVFGALWALGGLFVTVASAMSGGRVVIAYGAIIYGIITFARGLSASNRRG